MTASRRPSSRRRAQSATSSSQYATTANLTSAFVKNADGKFVPGSTDGVTAAAEAAVDTFPQDLRQAPIINGAGADTYPIASYTYLLVYQDQTDADKGKALVRSSTGR